MYSTILGGGGSLLTFTEQGFAAGNVKTDLLQPLPGALSNIQLRHIAIFKNITTYCIYWGTKTSATTPL